MSRFYEVKFGLSHPIAFIEQCHMHLKMRNCNSPVVLVALVFSDQILSTSNLVYTKVFPIPCFIVPAA